MELKVGDKVPKFEALDQDGILFNSADLLGNKNIVLYFYPKNFTHGCTKEAHEFKTSYNTFEYFDTEVFGVSGDSNDSHESFHSQLELPFRLLSDKKGELRELFGVKKELMGLISGRETFVIDKSGILRLRFRKLGVLGHVEEAIDCIKTLQSEK